MGLSKFLDPVTGITQTANEQCQEGIDDCQYLTSSGECSAEWCVYSQLPKMVINSRELTCSVCGKNKKTFSSYSGITSYTCPECKEKLKKITKDDKLCSVCGKNTVDVDQYICTDCQQKLIKVTKNLTCAICGTSISVGESICSSCSSKIREKLNESND